MRVPFCYGTHNQGIENGRPRATHRKGVHSQNNSITHDMAPLIYYSVPAECLDLYVQGLHDRSYECKADVNTLPYLEGMNLTNGASCIPLTRSYRSPVFMFLTAHKPAQCLPPWISLCQGPRSHINSSECANRFDLITGWSRPWWG
jgi:hypothetical protein